MQLTPSRNDNLTRLIHTLLLLYVIITEIHIHWKYCSTALLLFITEIHLIQYKITNRSKYLWVKSECIQTFENPHTFRGNFVKRFEWVHWLLEQKLHMIFSSSPPMMVVLGQQDNIGKKMFLCCTFTTAHQPHNMKIIQTSISSLLFNLVILLGNLQQKERGLFQHDYKSNGLKLSISYTYSIRLTAC